MDYDHNMDHHIQIISHDRDYSNVDVHEQAMLSTKAEERPTEKHLKSKMLARCMLGNAWLAHFLMIYCVSLFNLVRPLGLINNKDGELENCCSASWNVEAKTTVDDLIFVLWKTLSDLSLLHARCFWEKEKSALLGEMEIISIEE